MLPEHIALRILEAHLEGLTVVPCYQRLRLEPQLNYSGLMAKGAYRGWKRAKHAGRRKVGCFDFKVIISDGDKATPLVHPRVISNASALLDLDIVESIFEGKDPSKMNLDSEEMRVAEEVQLAMLEQDINWGDEDFQCWTLFPPSEGRRPRDFIMAYLRRCLEEPDCLDGVERMTAASGSRGVLPPPRERRQWLRYIEPASSARPPWLAGQLRERFREAAAMMPDNPYYAEAYPVLART